MTKKKMTGIPGADDIEVEEVEAVVREEVGVTRSTLTLRVPVVEGFEGYATRRVDVTLTFAQARKLRDILMGLDEQGATLENGQKVIRPVHAIAWMIENAG